jgi:L-arabonate dehydrase
MALLGEMPMTLRSAGWFAGDGLNPVIHRAWMRSQGHSSDMFDGRPVVGIANSWSETTPCNGHLRDLAEHVKRGVLRAGGFPLEFPVMSLGEALMKPTTMLYRNLVAMEVEESIRSLPFDSVVTLSGCDKTTVAMMLGVASVDVPAIVLTGGPMLRGMAGTKEIAGATGLWEADRQRRAGNLDDDEWSEVEHGLARSAGHCGVMGTASTMAAMVEGLGLTLPGAAAIPAVDSQRRVIAEAAGVRAVAMAGTDLTPQRILTEGSFHNAISLLHAIGGSTNAVVHLIALARRVGVDLDLGVFDRLSRVTPLLADVVPTGRYQMEDFYYAGGIPAVVHELIPLLDAQAIDVTGSTVVQSAVGAPNRNLDVIRTVAKPLSEEGGLAVVFGNLCPDGAVIKHGAASPHLLQHTGPAVVFENRRHLESTIDDPDLGVDADSVLVLKGGGPIGGPGMPEWGMLPIPKKLGAEGVEDMVRISDARMSGTSEGTCVLHIAPEAAVGGPLAIVETGDLIRLDVPARRLDLLVDEQTIAQRLAEWEPPSPAFTRGFGRLYLDNVSQANDGADFAFMAGSTPVNDPAYNPRTY